MDDYRSEVTYFRYCRTLDGRLEPIDTARQNGRVVPRFPRSITEPSPSEETETVEYRELVEEVSQNLTAVERGTWLRILDHQSIMDIAKEDGVARAAIYDRIHRMVEKNEYCAIWWRLKNKVNQHA